MPRRPTSEKNPDELDQKDRADRGRALRDHFPHFDPSRARSLHPGAGPRQLHRRRGAPDTRVAPGRVSRGPADRRQHVGSAVVLFPVLKRRERAPRPRLRHRPHHRIHLHRHRHRQPPRGRDAAEGRRRHRRRGHARRGRQGRSSAIHDWTFLLGPGWIVGVGNGGSDPGLPGCTDPASCHGAWRCWG